EREQDPERTQRGPDLLHGGVITPPKVQAGWCGRRSRPGGSCPGHWIEARRPEPVTSGPWSPRSRRHDARACRSRRTLHAAGVLAKLAFPFWNGDERRLRAL